MKKAAVTSILVAVARVEVIRLGLRELGYIEGQNIAIRVPILRGEVQSVS